MWSTDDSTMPHENIKKAEKVWFTLLGADHVRAMKYEIDFLSTISRYPLLHTPGPVLNNAIRRYETLFLPAVAKASGPIYGAPLDVQWVWHCHMLAPLYYHKDCERIFGRVPDHVITHSLTAATSDVVKSFWSQHVPPNEPLEVDLHVMTEFMGGPEYTPQCAYDLVGAVQRQSAFYYNVSLPHYKDDKFLSNAILRYKMMLQLKTFYPDAFLVPCYDMDLAWHTHQLHPHIYKKDTTEYLGKMFNHDDNMTDRSAESHLTKSEEKTKQLWSEVYGEHMVLSGAMYRGVSPLGKLGYITQAENLAAADLQFDMHIQLLKVENNHAARMRVEINMGRGCIYNCSAKRVNKATNVFFFESFHRTLSLLDDRAKTLTVTLEQTEKGCFASSEDVGFVPIQLGEFLTRENTVQSSISIESPIRDSTLTLQGYVAAPKPGTVSLILCPGPFSNVVMPETVEALWGPIPLRRMPAGVVNHCTVANHKLNVPGSQTTLYTARIIHCQPLLMSCVQIFYREKMVAVSHLVGTDQIPESTSRVIQDVGNVVTLRRDVGERGMLIKTAFGDRMFVFGHWANMKKGIPGTRRTRGTQGNPGNLKIRVSCYVADRGTWINYPEMNVISNKIDVDDMTLDLNGKVDIKRAVNVPEKLCLGFSVAVLTCLCQPPPPGIEPPKDASNLGVLPPPSRYQSTNRGRTVVSYNDGADLAFVVAAGWMMAVPTNFYIQNYWILAGFYGGLCGGACGGLAVCAGCGGFVVGGCAGGCGGCGGCGGG